MGTNYYARIIPTRTQRNLLKRAINDDHVETIKSLVRDMYGDFTVEGGQGIGSMVHLGKRAGGWKFLWNPNVYVIRNGHSEKIEIEGGYSYHWISEPDSAYYLYPLTKKGIKEFIDRKDVEIYDEYNDFQDKEEFWKMVLEWGYQKDDIGWDAASYEKERPSKTHYKCDTELTKLLLSEGYKFTSDTQSDFYSDGLRFAGFTDFC